MHVNKRWHKFTKENVDTVPKMQGVYEIAHIIPTERKLWRLGKTVDLRTRLLARLRDPSLPENCYFRYYEAELGIDLNVIEGEIFDSYRESTSQV
jgi:hypothetical protein